MWTSDSPSQVIPAHTRLDPLIMEDRAKSLPIKGR